MSDEALSAEERQVYADRLKTWADWEDLSAEAQGKLDQEDR